MDVVTIGETMAQFTPKERGYMRYATDFSLKIGGAESNVAIGLARLGHKVGWVSRLGDDEFGHKILSFIKGEGVDTQAVQFDQEAPTGIYFKEIFTEDELRVQYYRKGSAASRMTPEDLNESYMKQAKYLLITGITPALSDSCYDTTIRAVEIAKDNEIPVIFDPNLRTKLWSEEKARKTLLEIMKQSDIVLPGMGEGEFLLGTYEAEEMAHKIQQLGPKKVILKLGEKGAYYLSDQEQGYVGAYSVKRVVDPVGAGDGFAAGFISGLLDGLDLKASVQRGAAVGAMVTMIEGDVAGLPDRERLFAFMDETNREDVQR